jgi:hypothetical protein
MSMCGSDGDSDAGELNAEPPPPPAETQKVRMLYVKCSALWSHRAHCSATIVTTFHALHHPHEPLACWLVPTTNLVRDTCSVLSVLLCNCRPGSSQEIGGE